ncbi:hypothetical protein A2875_03720 [Candidatus Gottesmanbacteria bacterium RIFCSPHIGHO2_01_FULL_46_14]|uniref:Major facilitator superfamily (MFS) profile domain-containing protein n=3 Tax=Candidatus Gottesmaniibacteriota TaxID=1752720 RepID=A0A1F5ZMX8_9BACT|nr:MAG: Major facilitator superfamily [Candidatus Gottesmanbacteria bacterium GW2011_GWA1_47_8]OGG13850.1 MAG: hypothetical protein A2875_03720 [Candidatus Gottesmanbacteria bacterium RIFCSPHIGHO2_01_FULL_46_14]OGG29600.1 MAG: hypothetical protein A2971_00985 [Candidatus Gottesmanbacteria bacterium RIFCSPLOWO2_01_FULL_46_21]
MQTHQILKSGNFRYLWLGQIFSQLAANTMLFTLALIIYQRTGSNAAVSGLFLAYGVPAVLFGLLAGVIVDHFDKRLVLLVCDLSRALLAALLFVVLDNPFLVYAIVFLHAMITQFYVPAEAPTIPRLVTPDQITPANSLFSFTYYSSLAMGFILAGPLLRFTGPTITFGLIFGSSLIAALFIWRLPPQPGAHTLTMVLQKDIFRILRRVMSDLGDGIRYITSSPVLFDAILLLTGTQVVLVVLGSLGPGFADRVLEIDVRDASLYITAPVVVGIIIGALWVGNRGYRYSSAVLIKTGVLSAGVILMLVSVVVRLSRMGTNPGFFDSALRLPVVSVLFVLLGIANSLLDAPANSTLQREAVGSMRGRVYGMLTAAVGGVGMLPVVAGGVLADIIGVGKVIFALGAIITFYGLFRIRYNKA